MRINSVIAMCQSFMITGNITKAEFLAAQRLHSKPDRMLLLVYCLVAGTLILVGLLALLFGYGGIGSVIVGGLAGGVIGGLGARYLYYLPKLRKVYRQQADFQHSFQYSWDNETLKGSCLTGQSERPWSNYVKWKENENMVLLYQSDLQFEMFPKSWFQSKGDLESFLENVHGKIGTKR